MQFDKKIKCLIALVLAPTFFICLTTHTAAAAMVSTARVFSQTYDHAARERVNSFLDRADVRGVMANWGVEPAEAAARVAALTDTEVSEIASRIDSLPAGGNVVGPIVGAIVLIFLVLLVTDLLGLTDVFPFVKKKKAS